MGPARRRVLTPVAANPRTWFAKVVIAAGLLLAGSCSEVRDGPGFVPIFDGATLDGWRPDPVELRSSWSVVEGAIQATGIEDALAYLIYEDEENLRDFELAFSYRMLTDGNTGVEVRARVDRSRRRPFEGYHADLGHVGIGPNILGAWDFHFTSRTEFPCRRGERLVIDQNGDPSHEQIDGHVELQDIAARDWNRCRIVALGNHLQFFINGKISSEFTDGFGEGHLESGHLALQLHDKGMVVQFRDLALMRLD